MFGYIITNNAELSPDDQEHYRQYYCGLCHDLGTNYGAYCRTTLSYDMTLLAMVLAGSHPKDCEPLPVERCVMKPTDQHTYISNAYTAYAADINIALTYHKCLDDWEDDKNLIKLGASVVFKGAYEKVAEKWPRQCVAIEEGLHAIQAMEKKGELNPDMPTAVFGKLMGKLFVMEEAVDEDDAHYRFGDALGRFIYIMDAVMDLREDLKKERYNPLMATMNTDFKGLLTMLMAQVTAAYNQLPANGYHDIIENILLSGVWIRYGIEEEKRKKNIGQ